MVTDMPIDWQSIIAWVLVSYFVIGFVVFLFLLIHPYSRGKLYSSPWYAPIHFMNTIIYWLPAIIYAAYKVRKENK